MEKSYKNDTFQIQELQWFSNVKCPWRPRPIFSVTLRLSGMRQANDWLRTVPQDGRAWANFRASEQKKKLSSPVSIRMTEKGLQP